jgi:hypothetical protein
VQGDHASIPAAAHGFSEAARNQGLLVAGAELLLAIVGLCGNRNGRAPGEVIDLQ